MDDEPFRVILAKRNGTFSDCRDGWTTGIAFTLQTVPFRRRIFIGRLEKSKTYLGQEGAVRLLWITLSSFQPDIVGVQK